MMKYSYYHIKLVSIGTKSNHKCLPIRLAIPSETHRVSNNMKEIREMYGLEHDILVFILCPTPTLSDV